MKWFRPILLLFALPLPCSAADPLPPAEAAQLRAQRKTIAQEALAKIQKKEYPAAIPLLEECNRIQEKLGEINTPNTAVYFLYFGEADALTYLQGYQRSITLFQSGVPRTKALRCAQSEDHANPYFGAAFTLTGQWR